MAGHLTSEQFAAWRARTLAASELLQVDEHLASCDACRDRLFAGAQSAARELRNELSEHFAYDDIVAPPKTPPPQTQQNLRECSPCRDEVADIRRSRNVGQSPRPVELIAIAAGLILVLSLVMWALARSSVGPMPMLPVEFALTPVQRQSVRLARSTQALPHAPILDRLISRDGVLPGSAEPAKVFRPFSPVGTTVLGDRPLFRWQPAPGATSYVVAIFDEDFRKVAESPAVTAAEWQPPGSLPRERILIWQITATVGAQKIRAPQPGAGEARFQIVSAGTAAELDTLRGAHPSDHLLLAVYFAKAGALDEATTQIDALSFSDPDTASALLRSLRR